MKPLNTELNKILSKYVNNKSLYIIIIIGIAFMLLPSHNSTKKEIQNTQIDETYSDEERLSDILSKVSGVEEVSVMITYYGTPIQDIAFEEKSSEASSENSAIFTDGTPFIKGKTYPTVKGVIAVTKGHCSETTRMLLTDAISTTLNVPSYKVRVLEGKERN